MHRGQTSGNSRKLESKDEFNELVQRVKLGDAKLVLRKVFLYRGSECNVMQEIWIQDKANPDARANLLKSYSVVHVNYHAGATHPGRVQQMDLDITQINRESYGPKN